MLPELARKKSAAIVRRPDQTAVLPVPYASHVIVRRTKAEVLGELAKLEKKQYIASSSALARVSGGWAVKVRLLRPLPEPMPRWAKGAIVVGSILIGLALVGIGFMLALASLLGAVAQVPWKGMAIAAGMIAVLLFLTPGGRRCCKVVVEVWH